MNEKQVLIETRSRIARGWCQNAEAMRAGGVGVPATDPRACAWCLTGAVRSSVYEPGGPDLSLEAYELAIRVRRLLVDVLAPQIWDVPTFVLQDWNDEDGRTQADVLALIDKTIEQPRALAS